jgi:hypothetical protein
MGLDQYIQYKTSDINEPSKQVAYWRKFNALQNWFEKHHKIDNCGQVKLTADILRALEKDLLFVLCPWQYDEDINRDMAAEKFLPTTSGFFYGNTRYDDEYFREVERTHDLIVLLLFTLENHPPKEGYYYYTCWY